MTCEILKKQIADIQTQLNNMSKSNVKPELRRQDPAPLAPFEANLIHPDHPIHIYASIENWESLSDPEFRIQEIEKRGPLKEEKDIVNILSFWKFKVETPPALYMVYITDVDDDTITKFLARFMRLFDEKDIGKVNFLTVLLKKNKTDLQFIHINEKQFPLLHISEAESGLQDGGKALYRLIYKTLADVFEAKQPWVSFYDSTFLSPNLAACSSPDSLTLYPFDTKTLYSFKDEISTPLPAQGEFINILVCVTPEPHEPYLSYSLQHLHEFVKLTLSLIYSHVETKWHIGHAILVFSSTQHVENTKKEEIRQYFMKTFNFDNVLFCTMVDLRRKDDKSRTNYLEPQNMKEICQALLNTKTYRQPTFQLQDIFLSMS